MLNFGTKKSIGRLLKIQIQLLLMLNLEPMTWNQLLFGNSNTTFVNVKLPQSENSSRHWYIQIQLLLMLNKEMKGIKKRAFIIQIQLLLMLNFSLMLKQSIPLRIQIQLLLMLNQHYYHRRKK